MAQHQYDIAMGQNADTVKANQTVGAAIGTSALRLTIDDTNCTTKEQAIQMLKTIEEAVVEGTWPPTP